MAEHLFKRDGITLTELIITMAMVGIASAFLCTVLYGNWMGYDREILAADRQFEARTAIDKLSRDIRESENVVLGTHSLSLTLDGINVVYQIDANDQLTRQEGTGTANVLCEYVDQTGSGFSWSGPKAIGIDIELIQPERVFNSGGTKNVTVKLQSSVQRRHL